jgi:DNA-binding Lrp family transcriptional regulator
MTGLPIKVVRTFEELKKEKEHIYLKAMKNKYYVYRQTYEWRSKEKKSLTISEYLGRITPEGQFIKKIMSHVDEFERAKALIAEKGGEITWHKEGHSLQTIPTERIIIPKDVDLKLLTALSMNSRMSMSEIAKIAGIQGQTAYHKIKAFEKSYGIRYFAEINIEKLGYTNYMALVKFDKDKPVYNDILSEIEQNPHIQFAAVVTGDYDLLIYFVARDNRDMAYFIHNLRISRVLKQYRSEWYVSPLFTNYNIIPLRDRFFDMVKDRVWTKTRELSKPGIGNLLESEYVVMRELNMNGNINFTSLDEKYKLNKGTARYTYNKLKKSGIIKRVTITLEKLPIRYVSAFLLYYYDFVEVERTRSNLLAEIIKDSTITNRYTFVGEIGIPDCGLFLFSILNESDLNLIENQIRHKIRGIRIGKFVVTQTLVGELCYRRFDRTYSSQYGLLTEEYKAEEPIKKINYDIL